jgi:hypothetical protein
MPSAFAAAKHPWPIARGGEARDAAAAKGRPQIDGAYSAAAALGRGPPIASAARLGSARSHSAASAMRSTALSTLRSSTSRASAARFS